MSGSSGTSQSSCWAHLSRRQQQPHPQPNLAAIIPSVLRVFYLLIVAKFYTLLVLFLVFPPPSTIFLLLQIQLCVCVCVHVTWGFCPIPFTCSSSTYMKNKLYIDVSYIYFIYGAIISCTFQDKFLCVHLPPPCAFTSSTVQQHSSIWYHHNNTLVCWTVLVFVIFFFSSWIKNQFITQEQVERFLLELDSCQKDNCQFPAIIMLIHHIELGRDFTRRFPKRDRLTIVLRSYLYSLITVGRIQTFSYFHSWNKRKVRDNGNKKEKNKRKKERKKRVSWLLNNCCCRCLPGSVRIYEHHKGSHPSPARCRDDVQAHTTPLLIVWLADSHNHSTALSL